jgi:hypothetical protein
VSYPYSSLYLESQEAKLRLAQQFRNALALFCDAIQPGGIAGPDSMDENEFFADGAGI